MGSYFNVLEKQQERKRVSYTQLSRGHQTILCPSEESGDSPAKWSDQKFGSGMISKGHFTVFK